MSSLDLFIVNLAFPYIGREYAGTTLGSLSWVLNAYTIVFAAVLVPAGRWADRIGRRRVFVARPGRLHRRVAAVRPGPGRRRADRRQGHPGGRRGPDGARLAVAAARLASRRRRGRARSGPGRRSARSAPRSGRWSAAAWSSSTGAGCSGSTSRRPGRGRADRAGRAGEQGRPDQPARPDLAGAALLAPGRRPGRVRPGQGAGLGLGLGGLPRHAGRRGGQRRRDGAQVAGPPLAGDRARPAARHRRSAARSRPRSCTTRPSARSC